MTGASRSRVELRTVDGERYQLLVDGKDLSDVAVAVEITVHPDAPALVHVTCAVDVVDVELPEAAVVIDEVDP